MCRTEFEDAHGGVGISAAGLKSAARKQGATNAPPLAAPLSSWLQRFRNSEFFTMLLTSIWLTMAIMYFVPFLLLLPLALIPGVGTTLYRRAIGQYDHYGRVSLMLIPCSWCLEPIRVSNYDGFRAMKRKGNALLLSTHCSRIDWLIGVYLCCLDAPEEQIRTGFVAEFTTALMPLVGWSRVLFGDILVRRAFHKDQILIEDNIRSFHESKVKRLIFLAPEGFIADPGSLVGDQYIPECEQFMVGMGRKPLTHLLTPRYKGMISFVHHAPTNIGSCTMAFVDQPEVEVKPLGRPPKAKPTEASAATLKRVDDLLEQVRLRG